MSNWTAFNRGNGNNKVSGNTLAMVPNANMAGNSILVMRLACDNSGASGGSPFNTGGVTDTQGNFWTRVVSQNRTVGSVANDGITVGEWWTAQEVGLLTTSDTITLTFNAGVSVPAKAWALTEFQSDIHPTPVYDAADGGASSAASGTAYSYTSTSVPDDGLLAVIGGAAQTAFPGDDTDTTRGSWSTGVADATSGSTTATNVCMRTQHKAVTSAGTQTHNGTLAVNGPWAACGTILSALPPWVPKAVTTFV